MKKLAPCCTAKSQISIWNQAFYWLLSFKYTIIAAPWIWEVLVRMKGTGQAQAAKREQWPLSCGLNSWESSWVSFLYSLIYQLCVDVFVASATVIFITLIKACSCEALLYARDSSKCVWLNYFVFVTTLWGKHSPSLLFMDEEAEIQRGSLTWGPRPNS